MPEKNEVSPTDHEDKIKFTKKTDGFFSCPGINLNQKVLNEVEYYKEVERSVDVKKVCKKEMALSLALIF